MSAAEVTDASSAAAAVTVHGRHQLSTIQRSLLASQRRHPRTPLYNMAALAHIDGPVDPHRLAAAFADVVEASDVLRTTVRVEGDNETVVRLSGERAPTEIIELDRADVEGWVRQRIGQVVPLAERAHDSVVLAHPDGTVSWYLALHHLLTDATSSAEVFALTGRRYEGHDVEVGAYYEWARRIDEPSPRRDNALAYWSSRPPGPRLGRLYGTGTAQAPASRRVPVASPGLDADLDAALDGPYRALSRELAWTGLLATATAAYLHRLTAADELTLGVPVHNRSRPDDRRRLGPLVEVFPVDVVVEEGDTFATLHRRVARSLQRTIRHAEPGTAPAGNDIEAVVNVVPDAEVDRFGSFPATFEYVDNGAVDAHHLLRVQRFPYGGAPLALDLNDAAVAPTTHERAAAHFRRVLDAAVTDPDRSIVDVTLPDDDERAVIDAWGDGGEWRAAPPVLDRLERALRDAPHVALVDGDRRWTGGELWRHVEHVATGLQDAGVGPGVRVGVELPRSADAVIALLAVRLAGGSYVPLDPAQPESRRADLVDRADCRHVLRALDPLPSADVAATISPVERGPDDEAYLLFTSGSTGEPKGVPIPVRGLDAYVAFASDAYADDVAPPVAPLFTALGFDLTVTSIFLPLVSGGRLVVVAADGPAAVSAVAADRELTWIKATPSHLELLVRLLPDDHGLRTLVVGGEAFGAPLAARLRSALPGARIFNEYGPTEAVVGCMIHEWESDRHADLADVPIGRPAPGVRLAVMDAASRPVPIGAAGELWISHPGLTPGYLDGDDGAFVHHDGRRWYRSGDLVTLIDADTLVYLRRVDEQLKVGGIRLDPSEVEAALVDHPSVRRAAVRHWTPRHVAPSRFCVRCGLADNVPGVVFDDTGTCDRCHAFDAVRDHAEQWFRTPDDLLAIRDRAKARRAGGVDCIALLSGGKDSTYVLYQLVAMGFDVHALTLDNGFISDEAKDNVRRSVAHLGVSHEFATTEAMNAIFRDSLERHSNVCQGCFKTIYTLGTNRAVELGAPLVITGLSRGQLFETRLIPAQFSDGRFDPDAIDRAVVAARKAYHRADDAVNRLLDTEVFADDELFDRIEFVDFYRYVDVELAEMLRFLDEEAPWVRPRDTGRSTNCRINAAGIQTHLTEQGFHNYAEPYAWDVRLGHKQRDEALAELDDRDDADEVAAMLAEVDYRPTVRQVLTAWVEPTDPSDPPSAAQLRAHLSERLPAHAIPSAYVIVDELAMTPNGKLDTDALPSPTRAHRSHPGMILEPTTDLERTIVDLWQRRLGVEPISIDDDFFALGGDSLAALEMVVALSDELSTVVPEAIVFANATPRRLGEAIDEHLQSDDPQLHAQPRPGMGGDPPQLTAGEAAMVYEHRLRPDDARYNQGRRYRIPSTVDAARFERAVHRVVERHEPLHWTFAQPRVRLRAEDAVRFERIADPSADELDAWIAAIHRAPFDIERGPLLRCGVATMNAETTVVLATHHVSTDEHSFDRLWSEIEAAYHGDELPALPLSNADHGAWQRSRSDAPIRTTARPVAPLAVSRPLVAEPDGLHERATTIAAGELHAAGSTPFSLVVAAASFVVARYAGADHATVGALMSTREHPDADVLIGYHLNTVPITIDVGSATTAAELADASGRAVADAMSRRTAPLADVVAAARAAGDPDPRPQVLVALQELGSLRFGSESVEQEILHSGSAVADVSLFFQHRDGRMVIATEHRGRVLDRRTAERMLADLDHTLTTVLRARDTPLAELELPSTAGSILHGPPMPSAQPISARLATHLRPDNEDVAIRSGGRTVTWAELDRRSAAVAAALVDRGVGAGHRVAVALPRGAELVIAIVAILRAGGAYVPIDPAYPHERNRRIAGAARARLLLGDADLGLPQLSFEVAERDGTSDVRTEHPEPSLDDPAYVIFTSGSTGEPRGVEISHANLTHSTAARDLAYSESPGRFLLVSSVAFDSSVAGLFWTLASGGTLVLPTDHEVHDVDALVDLCASEQITHTLLVPSLYRALLDRAPEGGRWPSQVIVAGEACAPDIVTRHLASHPGSRLANEYGPTEATVWATVEHLDHAGPVAIGAPIAGSWTAVVDAAGRPVPEAVQGELVIGGPGVAQGYDDGSAGGFHVSSPLGPGPVFHTGDRVSAVDGSLHFHGRLDEQLNVGGLRVEPAEVEAVIESVAGVTAAVVCARDPRPLDVRIADAEPATLAAAMRHAADADDPARALDHRLRADAQSVLVAFVECAPDVDDDTLRRTARAELAPGSRPARIIRTTLPRLPNGKVDRRAAERLPVAATAVEAEAPLAADDPALQTIVDHFRAVLSRPDLDADADFFDEGGDSLTVLELLRRLEEALDVRPRVSVLLEARTPRALRASLDLGADRTTSEAIVVREGEVGGSTLWLVPGAGGALYIYEPLVSTFAASVRVLGVEYPGVDGDRPPAESVEEIAEHQLRAMRRSQPRGPYRLLGYSSGAMVALEVARRLRDEDEVVDFIVAIEGGPDAGLAERASPTDRAAVVRREGGWPAVVRSGVIAGVMIVRRALRSRVRPIRARLVDVAERRFGIQPSADQRFERIVDASQRAVAAYDAPTIDVPVLLLLGAERRADQRESMARAWSALTTAHLDVRVVPGRHEENAIMIDTEAVASVSDAVRDYLDRG